MRPLRRETSAACQTDFLTTASPYPPAALAQLAARVSTAGRWQAISRGVSSPKGGGKAWLWFALARGIRSAAERALTPQGKLLIRSLYLDREANDRRTHSAWSRRLALRPRSLPRSRAHGYP